MRKLTAFLLMLPLSLLAETDPKKLYEKDYNAKLADNVIGRAVLRGTITESKALPYCPLRTADCGHNPSCKHPKSNVNIYSIRGEKAVMHKGFLASSKVFENVNDFLGQGFKVGDPVYFFLVAYDDGRVSQPFKIKPIDGKNQEAQEPGGGK